MIKNYTLMIHITNHYHGSDLTAVGSTDNQLYLVFYWGWDLKLQNNYHAEISAACTVQ